MKKILLVTCVLLSIVCLFSLFNGTKTEKFRAEYIEDIMNRLDSLCSKIFVKSKMYEFKYNFPFELTVKKIPYSNNSLYFENNIDLGEYCTFFDIAPEVIDDLKNGIYPYERFGNTVVKIIDEEDTKSNFCGPYSNYLEKGNLMTFTTEYIDGFTVLIEAIYDESIGSAAFYMVISNRKDD